MGELPTSVVALGGSREHLDERDGVAQRVDLGVKELGVAACERDVGRGEPSRVLNQDPHVAHKGFARPPLEPRTQLRVQFQRDAIVLPTRSRPGDGLAAGLLVLHLGATLRREIVLEGE